MMSDGTFSTDETSQTYKIFTGITNFGTRLTTPLFKIQYFACFDLSVR